MLVLAPQHAEQPCSLDASLVCTCRLKPASFLVLLQLGFWHGRYRFAVLAGATRATAPGHVVLGVQCGGPTWSRCSSERTSTSQIRSIRDCTASRSNNPESPAPLAAVDRFASFAFCTFATRTWGARSSLLPCVRASLVQRHVHLGRWPSLSMAHNPGEMLHPCCGRTAWRFCRLSAVHFMQGCLCGPLVLASSSGWAGIPTRPPPCIHCIWLGGCFTSCKMVFCYAWSLLGNYPSQVVFVLGGAGRRVLDGVIYRLLNSLAQQCGWNTVCNPATFLGCDPSCSTTLSYSMCGTAYARFSSWLGSEIAIKV